MTKLSQKLENTFTAVAFAEQGEWNDAEKIAEGSPQEIKNNDDVIEAYFGS